MSRRKYGAKGAIHLTPVPGSEDEKGKHRKWDYSFSIDLPTGETHRERKRLLNMSKSQAQQEAEKRRNELLAPSPRTSTTTFKELIDHYRKAHLPTVSPAYQAKVNSTLEKRLLPTFGKMKLSQINRGSIDDYLITLRETCAPKTQRDHLALLHKILSLAVKWELLGSLPSFPDIKVPESDIPEFLTPEEHDTLLAHARDHEEFTLLLFATDSGTRSGEQLALKWGDIRSDQLVLSHSLKLGTVASGFKPPKSGKSRVIPMSNRLQAALAQVKAQRKAKGQPCLDTDLVFGNYIPSTKALYKRVKRACKRAGIKAISRHGLRHTYASWLISSGQVSLAELETYLGHGSSAMVQRYAHLIPGTGDNVRKVFDGVSKVVSSTGGLTAG